MTALLIVAVIATGIQSARLITQPTRSTMSHLTTCRTRREMTGNVWVYFSEPDQSCTDQSHTTSYTEESK